MELISRQDAFGAGRKRFFTGKPCKRGHIMERNVKTGACLGCLAHYARQFAQQKSGTITHSVQVFHEHTDAIDAFADLLRRSKIVGGPAPLVPPADHIAAINTFIQMLNPSGRHEVVTAPSAPIATSGRHAMWVRIHGQEIADQMMAQYAE